MNYLILHLLIFPKTSNLNIFKLFYIEKCLIKIMIFLFIYPVLIPNEGFEMTYIGYEIVAISPLKIKRKAFAFNYYIFLYYCFNQPISPNN